MPVLGEPCDEYVDVFPAELFDLVATQERNLGVDARAVGSGCNNMAAVNCRRHVERLFPFHATLCVHWCVALTVELELNGPLV